MASLRALIASPDESLLRSYRPCLSREGITVTTATDALECVANLREFRPDVLVLDQEILWGRTAGVLAALVEDRSLPNVPVIVLATEHDGEVESMLQSNLKGEIQRKDIDPSALAERIREIVKTPISESRA